MLRTFKNTEIEMCYSIRFYTKDLLKSIALCSSFISSINFFTFKPSILKEAIAFGIFEPVLMFLITFNYFSLIFNRF